MKSFAEKGIDIQKWIARIFELIFSFGFIVVLIICIFGTQHNIPWYNMVIITVPVIFVFYFLYFILGKISSFLLKAHWLLPVICAVWSLALYIFSCFSRNEPAHDYQIVYDAAKSYVQGLPVDWTYFARWGNNEPLFLLLATLMKASQLLGIRDPFYFILFFNVISVVGAGYCIYRVLEEMPDDKEEGTRLGFMGLIIFAGFIPCWGGTFNFYTDSVSLCFGILSVMIAGKAVKSKKSAVWLSFLAGGLWAAGFLFKATVAISLIAFVLVILWQKKPVMRKRRLLCIVTGFTLIWGCYQAVDSRLPSASMAELHAAPVEYWLAIGLSGNGSYGENEELASRILDTQGAENKKNAAREYILKNSDKLTDFKHLISKVRCNFASGNFGLSDYNRYPVNIFYDFFNDYGKYGGYVTMITTGYYYGILFLLILGALKSVFGGLPKREESDYMYLISQLTLFGLFIFLMIWEANNRQLYNHMTWFAIGGAASLSKLFQKRRQ